MDEPGSAEAGSDECASLREAAWWMKAVAKGERVAKDEHPRLHSVCGVVKHTSRVGAYKKKRCRKNSTRVFVKRRPHTRDQQRRCWWWQEEEERRNLLRRSTRKTDGPSCSSIWAIMRKLWATPNAETDAYLNSTAHHDAPRASASLYASQYMTPHHVRTESASAHSTG